MLDLDLLFGKSVRRRPSGRWCRVVDVDSVARKIKIRDGRWCGWINESTFLKGWTDGTSS